MNEQSLIAFLANIVNDRKVSEISLSKGGWEVWLQCEIWYQLNKNDTPSQREYNYPAPENLKRCDLFIPNGKLWLEIKAFGIFREESVGKFMNDIAFDVHKLSNFKPKDQPGLMLVVVPKAIDEKFISHVKSRRINGYQRINFEYMYIYKFYSTEI